MFVLQEKLSVAWLRHVMVCIALSQENSVKTGSVSDSPFQ